MKKIYSLLILTSFIFGFEVKEYRAINQNICFEIDKKEFKALREFKFDGVDKLLAVDTSSMDSLIIEDKNYSKKECNKDSKYQKLLTISSSPPYPLQNDGITTPKRGIFITTDLCPSSKKGFEERLYKALIQNFQNPAPVTLFITKRWIQKHKKSFEQLKSWDKNGSLKITWGNHTAYHHYHPKVPLKQNFVLSPEENLTKDVLDLEVELVKDGITPSVFFRFPGLVSDKKSVELIKELGLITIGSNCWLAKGEKIKDGVVILLHGNKNEPKGVDLLIKAIKDKKIEKIEPINRLDL